MIWDKIVGAILIFIFIYYKVFLQKAVPLIYQQLWTGFSVFVGIVYLIKGSMALSVWLKKPKEVDKVES